MDSLVLSPTSAKQDLIPKLTAVLAFPKNVTLTSQSGITSEAICLIDPQPSPKGRRLLPETIHYLLETSFFCLLLPIKTFPFVRILRVPFYLLRWDAAHLLIVNKANSILHLPSCILFCFNNRVFLVLFVFSVCLISPSIASSTF